MSGVHVYLPRPERDAVDTLAANLSRGCVSVSRSAIIREAIARGLPEVAKAHGVALAAPAGDIPNEVA